MVSADAKAKVEQIPALIEGHLAFIREAFTKSQADVRTELSSSPADLAAGKTNATMVALLLQLNDSLAPADATSYSDGAYLRLPRRTEPYAGCCGSSLLSGSCSAACCGSAFSSAIPKHADTPAGRIRRRSGGRGEEP